MTNKEQYEQSNFKKIVKKLDIIKKRDVSVIHVKVILFSIFFFSCNICAMSQFSQEEKGPDSWHTVRGKFLAVASFTMSCRCLISPIGPSPYCHLGDGTSDLLLIQQCSRIQFLRHLYRCSTTNGNQVTTHVLWCYVDYCTGTCISTIFTLFNYTCFSLFDVVLFFLSVTLLCDGLIVFWVALYYIF